MKVRFLQGMGDAQLAHLLEVLKLKRIWAVNIGENFQVRDGLGIRTARHHARQETIVNVSICWSLDALSIWLPASRRMVIAVTHCLSVASVLHSVDLYMPETILDTIDPMLRLADLHLSAY